MKSITINGKTYYPGDEVEVEIDGQKHRLPFPKDPGVSESGELSDDALDAVTGGAGSYPVCPGSEGTGGTPICDVASLYIGALCFETGSTLQCFCSRSNGYAIDSYTNCQGLGPDTTVSDARVKQDVQPLEGALDTLLALRGVTFAYDAEKAPGTRPGEHVGFVAQEVEEVLPTWVHEAGGIKRLKAEGLSFEALAVEALRELKKQNERLAEDNAELRKRLDRIESA
ncbi:MAG: tail fiber domain-containing protein [Deltaproteobacteria bacterium]|jgi:hypothetical protein